MKDKPLQRYRRLLETFLVRWFSMTDISVFSSITFYINLTEINLSQGDILVIFSCLSSDISSNTLFLKGVFAKNERGYRRNAKNKSF